MPKHLFHDSLSSPETAGMEERLLRLNSSRLILPVELFKSVILQVAPSEELSWLFHVKRTITVAIIIKSSLQNCEAALAVIALQCGLIYNSIIIVL